MKYHNKVPFLCVHCDSFYVKIMIGLSPEFDSFALTVMPDFWKDMLEQIIPFCFCVSKSAGNKNSDSLLLTVLQTFAIPPQYLLLQVFMSKFGFELSCVSLAEQLKMRRSNISHKIKRMNII